MLNLNQQIRLSNEPGDPYRIRRLRINTRFHFLSFLLTEAEPELESEKQYLDDEPAIFLLFTCFFFFLLFLDKDTGPSVALVVCSVSLSILEALLKAESPELTNSIENNSNLTIFRNCSLLMFKLLTESSTRLLCLSKSRAMFGEVTS